MRRDYWINFKDVGVIGELYFLTVLRMIHHNTWKLNQNLKNEDETEILLVHIFYWMQTSYLQEICKNIFVFLWGPASNKMKMKKKREKNTNLLNMYINFTECKASHRRYIREFSRFY